MPQTTNTPTAVLEVTTASGAGLAARLVLYGEHFGPDGRYQNGGRALIEFRRLGVSSSIAYINSFQLDMFESIPLDRRFSPDGTLPLALPIREVERLVAWLEQVAGIEHEGSLV